MKRNPEGAVARLAVREMANGPVTAKMLAALCGITEAGARNNLRALHEAKLIHIASWMNYSDRGAPVPRYAAGKGKDAPRPKAMTDAERMRKYRRENPEYEKRRSAVRTVKRDLEKRKAGIKKPGIKPDFWRM